MDITKFAISKTRVTAVAFLVIATMGLQSYVRMPRAEDPGFTIRTALVTTMFPGASPERVEQLVTDKLEKVIQEMPEIDFIASQSKTGLSIIYVNILERYTLMQPIWDKLRRKVDRARGQLPEGVIGPNVDDEFGDVFGTIVTITGDDFDYAYLKEVADEVRDEILLIDEVAKVEIHGAQEERIFVEYNNARLSEIGLSPAQLRQILGARNITLPGGDIRTADEQIVLEPSGNFESLEDLGRTVVNVPGGSGVIFLEDVAEISRGYIDPPSSIMRTSGSRSLGLAISLREGGNILILGEQVLATIDRVRGSYPIGIEFDFIQFQADDVSRLIDDFVGNLLQAIAVVTLVMLLSLGLRTGLVVASLIPMTILTALVVMNAGGIGLNQLSIASLIIALGMLVDNAIVMSESIMVQMREGKPPVEAALSSAHELRVPLLTSSLTTCAAFLPIYLAESMTGEYVSDLFWVVSITLLCSWVISLTLIPLLCVKLIRVAPQATGKDSSDSYDTTFYRRYRAVLLGGLRHPWLALAGVAVLFFAGMSLFSLVPNIFFPPNSRPTLTADLTLPTGTPIERTEAMVIEFDRFIRENLMAGEGRPEGVVNWASFVGEGSPRFILPFDPENPRPEYAMLLVNATSRPQVDVLVQELESFANASFPDLKAVIMPLPLGPPAWPPIEVRISGRDTEILLDIVDQVKEHLREMPGTKNIDDDWGTRIKKLFVDVDQPRALRAGVSSQDIAISLQAYLTGIDTTEFREGDEIIPITLRSVARQRQDLDRLESLNVYSQSTGASVPLLQVADARIEWQPAQIFRRDRLRTVTVEAGLKPGVTAAEINALLVPWLEQISADWGLGYAWELGGETETSDESNASIMAKLPIAMMIIVLLLVSQFNSIRRPLIILMTIPLALIGVGIGLVVADSYFGFMTLLGVISLAGIVINNAIVLLDRIRIEIEENGRSPALAVVESAQRRLRPILLTTATTVGGLLPLYLGGGPMWEPMAVAIMSGLLFATMLTLGVVPILYSLLFGVSFKGFEY
jgi:multidrug efflux pump subunit AcrB